ncbi:hypothetical protein SARI_04499 [Salmonella enterica subsp. arizonae serovar 62:z4,z23:-]|uniref:Uncharacterized protein n=1 Tax=Salmonella arizonae (strain ATCC BAA-731 / CDC346-86 / RSK2980) TaxID=41514 RepID=A9MQM9_SALAR|nr:hypothetical protein SARI_04499 [Salmonella enterica subsp. arizonae serovar 62:z4,z23:-]
MLFTSLRTLKNDLNQKKQTILVNYRFDRNKKGFYTTLDSRLFLWKILINERANRQLLTG